MTAMTDLLAIITDAAGLTDEQAVAVLRAISDAGYGIYHVDALADQYGVPDLVNELIGIESMLAAAPAVLERE